MLVQMQIAAERFMQLKNKRRNLTGRTGCGLCGAESLEHAIRHPSPVNHQHTTHASLLFAGMHAMQQLQPLQQRSGATHAAAWMRADGLISCVREDVGRHNALDKLIGALIQTKTDFTQGAVLITSRASYEMVQKAASMNIGLIAALSAPTSLAIQLAEQANVTLAGFVKQDSHVIYAHPERLIVN
jgi:FdhD protein